MAGLAETMAHLLRQKRHWQKLSAAAANTAPLSPAGGRLTETVGFGADPGNLRMLSYRPAGLQPGAPLVVVLHGCTQSAEGYAHGAGWLTLADKYGFAVLAPEQRQANNPNRCFNWFQPEDFRRGSGEAASIRAMIDHVVREHGLDPARVFVTGLSAGGAMAAAMLAAYPEVFAAGAVVAGLPYGTAHNVQEALDSMFQGRSRPAAEWGGLVRQASPHTGRWPRVSIWHGNADATVVPGNAEQLVRQWTNVHGLEASRFSEDKVDGHKRRVWRDAAGRVLVESYTIGGLGHGTPIAAGSGAESYGEPGAFILEAGISSSYRIAQFWHLTEIPATAASEVGVPEQAEPRATPEPPKVIALPPRLPQPAAPASEQPEPADEDDAVRRAGRGGIDPGAVITRALKAAGLIKG